MTKFGYTLMTEQSGQRETVKKAHDQFRWLGGGWPVNADLPTPAGPLLDELRTSAPGAG